MSVRQIACLLQIHLEPRMCKSLLGRVALQRIISREALNQVFNLSRNLASLVNLVANYGFTFHDLFDKLTNGTFAIEGMMADQ